MKTTHKNSLHQTLRYYVSTSHLPRTLSLSVESSTWNPYKLDRSPILYPSNHASYTTGSSIILCSSFSKTWRVHLLGSCHWDRLIQFEPCIKKIVVLSTWYGNALYFCTPNLFCAHLSLLHAEEVRYFNDTYNVNGNLISQQLLPDPFNIEP